MNNRGGLGDWAGFVAAFIIMSLAFLVVISISFFVNDDLKLGLVLDDDTGSKVCNQNLLSYLRATGSNGLEFSRMINFAEVNPDFRAEFELETNAYFEKFRRGDETREGWLVEVSKSNAPILRLGTLQVVESDDTCKQIIPSLNGGNLLITMGVEY